MGYGGYYSILVWWCLVSCGVVHYTARLFFYHNPHTDSHPLLKYKIINIFFLSVYLQAKSPQYLRISGFSKESRRQRAEEGTWL